MLHKNVAGKRVKATIFKRMIIDGMLGCIYLLQGKLKCFHAIIKAHNHYRAAIPELDRKREELLKEITESKNTRNQIGMLNGLMLWSYARGKKIFSDYNL